MQLDVILNRNFSSMSEEYSKFAVQKDLCRSCSIYNEYKQNSQSEGNASNPTFMFIGEAYGKDEQEEVRPFIGRAGQRLRNELRKYKIFNKNSCILSNVLGCRPKDNKFPSLYEKHILKYSPSTGKDVVEFCSRQWLFQEISILKPKVIVTLGAVPLQYVRQEKGITEHRGSWKFLDRFQCWSLATYHPSYVLRCENDDSKSHIVLDFERDIKTVSEEWANLVSNDQRMQVPSHEWNNRLAKKMATEKHILNISDEDEESYD